MPWTDYDDLEWHFTPSRVSPEARLPAMAVRDAAGAEAMRTLTVDRDIVYGTGPRQKLDFFPAVSVGKANIIHVYVHGGFWRQGHKDSSSYVAPPSVRLGLPTVVLGYDLCPEVTLERVVEEVMEGIAWVYRHGERLGIPGARIFVSGHSAGAHLCAMALACDWSARNLPADLLAGAALSSGIYDLAPVTRISVNEAVKLTPDRVRANSPMFNPPRRPVPVLLLAGGDESPGWFNQTEEYAEVCRAAGCPVTRVAFPGHNHFTLGMAAHGREDSVMMQGIAAIINAK